MKTRQTNYHKLAQTLDADKNERLKAALNLWIEYLIEAPWTLDTLNPRPSPSPLSGSEEGVDRNVHTERQLLHQLEKTGRDIAP